jgi:hypothetical protein
MSKELLGPDGKPVPKGTAVLHNGRYYPYRVVNQEVFEAADVDPKVGLMATLIQMGDQNNLIWLGLMELAKDIYSRNPEGSRHFESLVKQLNMNILDLERKSTDIAQDLSNY